MNVASFWWLLIVVTEIIFSVHANWITGNLCWSMPCMNGGSCFGSSYTYLCVCPINYSGALCEKRLGICQESPCGNRGLCVETGITSFECRCYFDYMGPLCEEHIPKNDASVWSSLIPVHTRVLFDILQEAYRKKPHGRSGTDAKDAQADLNSLLNINDVTSSLSAATITPSTITPQSETTEEHIIPAEDIQLVKIFPEISTISISDKHTDSFTTQTFETTDDQNQTSSLPTAITSNTITYPQENITSILTTVEYLTTISMEQNQTDYLNTTNDLETLNTTEQYNTTITSVPIQWSSYNNSDNNTIIYTTESYENSTEQINNNTESQEFLINTTISQTIDYTASETTNYLSNQTDSYQFNTSEQTIALTINSTDQTITSTLIPIDPTLNINESIHAANMSKSAHSQLLLKLCQQLLSHILPNVSSMSSSAAIQAALTLSQGSPMTGNNSAEALLAWVKDQLNSSSSSPSPLTTITTTTTTISSTSSSSLPSLLINEKEIPSMSLQRVDMDDVLHQMNNNIDGEN